MADLLIKDVGVAASVAETDKVPLSQGGTTPVTAELGQIAALARSVVVVSTIPLGGHRVVTIHGTYADCTDLTHAEAVVGVSAQAVAAGGEVMVQRAGVMSESGWSWTPGAAVYLGEEGLLRQTPPPEGFLMVIGIAASATSILIDIQPAIHLA